MKKKTLRILCAVLAGLMLLTLTLPYMLSLWVM
jgi:hypothetical protein